MNGFREITPSEFYESVGRMNVTPHSVGNYPYIQKWIEPSGAVRGITKPGDATGKGKTYWVPDGSREEEFK